VGLGRAVVAVVLLVVVVVVVVRELGFGGVGGGARERPSDLVVDVGGALRGHLLHDVHRVAVVAAHLLVVRAVVVFCPQRDDDVAGLGARRAARHLGVGQRAERQRRGAGLPGVGAVLAGALAHLQEQDDEQQDEQEEDDAAGADGGEDGHLGVQDAARGAAAAAARRVPVGVCGGERRPERERDTRAVTSLYRVVDIGLFSVDSLVFTILIYDVLFH